MLDIRPGGKVGAGLRLSNPPIVKQGSLSKILDTERTDVHDLLISSLSSTYEPLVSAQSMSQVFSFVAYPPQHL